jgi:hypothetical protein
MKNLKSVNREFLYSLYAVLLLLTCSLLTSAKGGKFGHYKPNPYTLTSLGLGAVESFGKSLLVTSSGDNTGHDAVNYDPSVVFTDNGGGHYYYQNSFYNDSYALENNWGALNSGNDRWIKITVPPGVYGTLYADCGTIASSNYFDSVLHLVDSSGSYDLTYNDDLDTTTQGWVGASINYTVGPGVYYLVLDGTAKYGHDKNGGVGITILIN